MENLNALNAALVAFLSEISAITPENQVAINQKFQQCELKMRAARSLIEARLSEIRVQQAANPPQ